MKCMDRIDAVRDVPTMAPVFDGGDSEFVNEYPTFFPTLGPSGSPAPSKPVATPATTMAPEPTTTANDVVAWAPKPTMKRIPMWN